MKQFKLYVRLLEELRLDHAARSTIQTRLRLQDVLIALREKAAREEGESEEAVQRRAERESWE